MVRRTLFLITICILFFTSAHCQEIRIGVLAHRADSLEMWSPLAEYLSQTLSGYDFVIETYDNSSLESAVMESRVDFVLTNPGSYVNLEYKYGITRIATLRNLRQGMPYTQFGSVIFTLKKRDDINSLEDLRGKRFAAIKENAFGGFLIGAREIKDAGIDPFKDIAQLIFTGLPQGKVVDLVLKEEADAGIVRTDTLESLHAQGKIDLSYFKILHQQERENFPFLLSSRLYPEWPFSKARQTSEALSKKVCIALLQLPENSTTAKESNSAGWTVPLDYESVHALYRDLKVGPYKDFGKISFVDILKLYWHWVVLTVLVLLLLTVNTLYIYRLNKNLQSSQDELINITKHLEVSNKQLKELSNQDGLTKIPNRRYFEEQLGREWRRCMRSSSSISLMMCDIDYFKKLNDTYGHQQGDVCLKKIANALRSVCRRPADMAARYGGEEFAIVLPETSTNGALTVASRVHETIARLKIEHESSPISGYVTLSIGIATVIPKREQSFEGLILSADQALYLAKQNGRSRTETARHG